MCKGCASRHDRFRKWTRITHERAKQIVGGGNHRTADISRQVGMRREESSRKTALHRSGEWMDGLNYGLLAEEWAGRR